MNHLRRSRHASRGAAGGDGPLPRKGAGPPISAGQRSASGARNGAARERAPPPRQPAGVTSLIAVARSRRGDGTRGRIRGLVERRGVRQRCSVAPESRFDRLPSCRGEPLEQSGQEYFVAGMHEALITDLARIGVQKVIAKASAERSRNQKVTP